MQAFDLLHNPLDGANIIEASAGTGKTYTIAGLYLRFVLEKELTPEQVLVVTFTEAATKELRDRIRKRLRAAVEAFSGEKTEDALLIGLIAKAGDPGKASRRLTQALRDFDRAAIFTIHGFCQRVLHENAFESSSLFDTELITDQGELQREIMEDFWRKHFYEAPSFLVRYALLQGYGPATFLGLVSPSLSRPGLKILPMLDPPSLTDMEGSVGELVEAVDRLGAVWPGGREEISAALRDPGLNGTVYGSTTKKDEASGATPRDTKVLSLIQSMDELLATRDPVLPLPLFKGFDLFTASRVARAAKKNAVPPSHQILDLCEAIARKAESVGEALDRYLLFLKTQALKYLGDELPVRKQAQNIQHFDDLLLRLKKGIEQPGGAELASAVREKFQAALIDEFQDTDPIQYAIFHSIFGEKKRPLFLIGDPKQAIYSFRGADIFTYMEAVRRADNRYTLDTNWRSGPDLIQAVNTIFESRPDPFVYPEISFHPVAASPAKEERPLIIEDLRQPPLQLWFFGSDLAPEGERSLKKPDAQRLILDAVASEISRLLRLGRNGQACLGESPLKEGHIAVLARTNDEARQVQQALASARVTGVIYSTEDVFDSHEATEMERVLAAVAEPHRDRLVRGALATDMLGLSGEDLASLGRDEALWEARTLKFREYFRLWSEFGFIRMFRHLMLDEKVKSRLLAFEDGERRVTNVLHLSEVLHRETVQGKLGAAELLKWLAEQRSPEIRQDRENQLRLESDENAVKIVTVHKSKGLEYPIVFCPFSWGGSKLKPSNGVIAFHEESEDRGLTLDLGSAEWQENRVLAEREALAENVRLLYVALTRAKSRCTLAWGPFNTAETSALAFILHGRHEGAAPDVVAKTELDFRALTDDTLLEDLRKLEDRAGGSIQVSRAPFEKDAGPSVRSAAERGALECRVFQRTLERSWGISSFSALTSGLAHGGELPDRDETDRDTAGRQDEEERPAPPPTATDIFAFPRGAKPGTLIHDILEHLDFAGADPRAVEGLVGQKLKEYGFDLQWTQALCGMIQKVLTAPLGTEQEPFTLSEISFEDRLNELEFYFPLKLVKPQSLKSVFAAYGCSGDAEGMERSPQEVASTDPEGKGRSPGHDEMEKLSFRPVEGFMKGFMDLVFRARGRFYLVDWKSNHLGDRVENYGPRALADAMKQAHYTLQYHLYTVAIHRYLSLRMPGYDYDAHFGGVYYFFVRGVDPAKGPRYGVFSARPAIGLVEALCDLLIPGA